MSAVQIEKFISVKVIGYSADRKITYLESEIEYSDASVRTIYNTNMILDDGELFQGPFFSFRPHVAIPYNPQIED